MTTLFTSCIEEEKSTPSDPLDLMGTSFSDTQGRVIPIVPNLRGRQQVISHQVLLAGSFSDVQERTIKSATSIEEFEEIEQVILKNTTTDQLPEVNFETENILAIFSGIRSNSGYSLAVTNVWQEDGKLILGIRENVENEVTSTVITEPFIIVTVPKTSLEIEVMFE